MTNRRDVRGARAAAISAGWVVGGSVVADRVVDGAVVDGVVVGGSELVGCGEPAGSGDVVPAGASTLTDEAPQAATTTIDRATNNGTRALLATVA